MTVIKTIEIWGTTRVSGCHLQVQSVVVLCDSCNIAPPHHPVLLLLNSGCGNLELGRRLAIHGKRSDKPSNQI